MAPETKLLLGDREIGLLYALPAIEYIYAQVPEILGKSEVVFTLMQSVHVIYGGYQNYCLAERLKEDVPFRAIYDWVDEQILTNQIEEIRRILDLFAQSKYIKAKPEAEDEKKKKEVMNHRTGTKSKGSASARTGNIVALPGVNTSYSLGDTIKTG